MRDRLIELMKEAEKTFSNTGKPVLDIEEYVADHLLANGVIVPPCKVGQTVYVLDIYYLGRWELFECEVKSIDIYEKNTFLELASIKGCFKWGRNVSEINSTVFLTREEAEKALAERREG